MVEGDRPHGRPARRWSDDIADWCSYTLPEAVQLALDRTQWRKITGPNSPHHENCDVYFLFRICLHSGEYRSELIITSEFPRLLENPGKSLIYFSKISRTWKVQDIEFPGKKTCWGPAKYFSLIEVQVNRHV